MRYIVVWPSMTEAQALAVLRALTEKIHDHLKMGRRWTRELVSLNRIALKLAEFIGSEGAALVFPAMRLKAEKRKRIRA